MQYISQAGAWEVRGEGGGGDRVKRYNMTHRYDILCDTIHNNHAMVEGEGGKTKTLGGGSGSGGRDGTGGG